jgi:hypothetical protein
MSQPRFLLLLALGIFAAVPLRAQDSNSPVLFSKQFSADMTTIAKNGMRLESRVYTDSSLLRAETNFQGMKIVTIFRPAEQKMYAILDAQKIVMEMPYDAEKYKEQISAATGIDGTFTKVGPDTIEGIACTKYTETSTDGHTYNVWADANKLPVKIAATDGSFTMFWKNYVPGPQSPELFQPPTGYQVMSLPALPETPVTGMPASQ